ncbi:MAG: rhomboid family intramembrane serine protease [Clostridiales bacterium]|nr:rhomboid family intramembrane serine protease [Clostridiales bacterium]
MKLLNKLERKFGRYAIPNLMKYVVMLYVLGLFLGMFAPGVYNLLFSLNFNMIRRGQVWRLVTFIIPNVTIGNLLFVVITVYLYYMIGNALERAWGTFRFNLYFISGILFNLLSSFIIYLITGISISPSLDYVYSSMFFAFAAIYPDTQFLIYFLIPVKVKYLAWINAALYIVTIIQNIIAGQFFAIIPIIVSMANFLIFFFSTRNYYKISPREFERKARFRRQMAAGRNAGPRTMHRGHTVITRHKCAVCGRTELDDDQLEFRFCSKCDGNYEYCMEHLFTHQHVNKS